MYCDPPCVGCKVTGLCSKEHKPVPASTTKRAPYWPDSLAGKMLACGHRAPIIPTTLGVLNPIAVQCERGCGWQPLPKDKWTAEAVELPEEPLF